MDWELSPLLPETELVSGYSMSKRCRGSRSAVSGRPRPARPALVGTRKKFGHNFGGQVVRRWPKSAGADDHIP